MNDKNQFYLREFDNKYFLNSKSDYRFFKFIEIYVRTRYFDDKVFRENMDEATKTQVKKRADEVKKYLKLLNGDYYKISDVDFEILWKQVIEEVKAGQVLFRDYVKLFSVFKYLINTGLIKYNVSELKLTFILGMQISANNNIKEIYEKSNYDLNEEIDASDRDILEIKDQYIKTRNMVIEEEASKLASDVFKLIPNEIQEFYRLMISDYKDLPVFSRYDADRLYERLEMTPNYDLYNFINLLNVRYKDNKVLLESDIKSLDRLAEIIIRNNREKMKTENKTIKMLLMENICDAIQKLDKE